MANHFELLNVELSSAPTVISFGGGVAEYSFALFDTFSGPELTVATSGTAAIASAGGPVELASGAIVDSGELYSAYPNPEPIPYSPGVEELGLAYSLPDGVHYGYAELSGTTLVGYGTDEQPAAPIAAGFIDYSAQPGLTFYQDDVFGDTVLQFNADPGSSPIYTVEGPVFDGVSAYAIQTEVGSAWSAPFIAQPGALTVLTVPADAVVFEPLDAYGNPVAVSGNVAVGLGFASGAQGGVTFAEQAAITPATVGVYRFFDTGDGTHFFTADSAERDQLLATRPDLTYEGVGLDAVSLSAADPNAEPVYRFFSTADGTHFFTSSTSERDSVEANRLDLTYEGVGFYEDRTQQSGDSAVYRFFDTIHGTHLYTSDESERASIVQSRPDLTLEGVGFYAPHG